MRRRGFTLIEILIAMAVFLIGIVSILALFPVGIKSSKMSTDQSVAAALAESLDDALTLALRQYDGVAGAAADPVHFYHDGLGNTGHDTFQLPALEVWYDSAPAVTTTATSYLANGRSTPTWYPHNGTPTDFQNAKGAARGGADPAKLASIRVDNAGNPSTKGGNVAALATTGSDFPDPLSQYSFRFMCHEYKNPNDPDGDENPCSDAGATFTSSDPQFHYQNGAQAEVVDKLFQFTLYVYRGWVDEDHSGDTTAFQVWTQGPSTAWSAPESRNGSESPYTWEDQMQHSAKIERFEFTIYAQGARQP